MKILFINPPVYDFSAYDLWAKPVGFLKIIDVFVKNGFEIFYFDFMDRNHRFYENLKRKKEKFGCGKYYFEIIEKPQVYKDVPRRYKRFGLPEKIFYEFIGKIGEIDFIFISSGMTYWVLGIKEIVEICKKVYPSTPIILGGIYATFCYYDAEKLPVNMVFRGKDIQKFINDFSTAFNLNIKIPEKIFPYWDVYEKLDYLVVKTSYGCPFSCYYCGIKQIEPEYFKREKEKVIEEIIKNVEKFHISDIAFYDDALLFDFGNHLFPIISEILKYKKNLRFHTPNGLNPRFITKEVVEFLKFANFKTLRLSLETIEEKRMKESSFKVNFSEFEKSIKYLIDAGFEKEDLGVYILAGLPGQSPYKVMETIKILKNYPCKIKIAEYSPIPGTVDFEIARKLYPELPIEDPLYQNNSIFPLWNFENKWEIINQIKNLAKN